MIKGALSNDLHGRFITFVKIVSSSLLQSQTDITIANCQMSIAN